MRTFDGRKYVIRPHLNRVRETGWRIVWEHRGEGFESHANNGVREKHPPRAQRQRDPDDRAVEPCQVSLEAENTLSPLADYLPPIGYAGEHRGGTNHS